jgi:hypothetical protein
MNYKHKGEEEISDTDIFRRKNDRFLILITATSRHCLIHHRQALAKIGHKV